MTGRGRPALAAALPLRSRNRKISYREPSSDTDGDNDNFEPRTVNIPRRSSRKRRRRVDEEDFSESQDDTQAKFRAVSSLAADQSNQRSAKIKPPSSRFNRKIKTRGAAVSRIKKKSQRARRINKTDQRSEITANGNVQDFDILRLGGKVPPWQTLPYEILLQIFQYALYPLLNEDFYPTPLITSGRMLKTALLCKGFAEPTLAALYDSPPLSPPSRAHKLLALLKSQNEQSYMSYRGMIKHLDVDAHELLSRKHQGQEPIEIGELLMLIPQIRTVGLHLLYDQPAQHKRNFSIIPKVQGKRWAYQPGLFHTLSHTDIRLLGWTWNAVLAQQCHRPDMPYGDYHQWKAFQTLKSLTLVNSSDSSHTKRFASATSVLPRLTTLTFQNVEIQDTKILETLPKNLKVLKFVNCPLLDSLGLAKLLRTHGSSLQDLVLDHNDSLDLLYLQDLPAICPNLKRIKMDLRFYNTHFTYSDSEPKFDALLLDGAVPCWPKSLERIELFQLRKWDMAAAETFFSSIVESAPELPDLRYIDIKASLAESNWRDRIGFRNKWISRMENTFMRVSAPPDPRFRSIATFEAHRKEFQKPLGSAGMNGTVSGLAQTEDSNSFSHVPIQNPGADSSSDSDDIPLATKRRSTRLGNRPDDRSSRRSGARKRRKHRHGTEDESSSEGDSALEDSDTDEDSHPNLVNDGTGYTQGMCDVVRVVIDNLRPTQEHLDESYFLDDEISGDEDWNGEDGVGGGGGYAW
ncbi:MAG: hypothetical protein LQ338_001601 [Usnochroma carphineum]|nr:MAG: hypothetical protein LQ338_001601 [Usnochroma carphineum]